MLILLSRPTPATAPKASQSRSSPPFSSSTARRKASAQKSRSKPFIDSTEVSPSTIGERPTVSPVRATA